MSSYFNDFLKKCSDTHTHSTRNKNNFYVNCRSRNKSFNSIFIRGVVKYNSLPQSLKTGIMLTVLNVC